MPTITRATHPQTFVALQDIDYAQGAVNRAEPVRVAYDIPDAWANRLPLIERQLWQLNDDERFCLCDGECQEVAAIVALHGIQEAHAFLDDYVSGWESTTQPREES